MKTKADQSGQEGGQSALPGNKAVTSSGTSPSSQTKAPKCKEHHTEKAPRQQAPQWQKKDLNDKSPLAEKVPPRRSERCDPGRRSMASYKYTRFIEKDGVRQDYNHNREEERR
jgi:hypothetical protein